MTSLARGQNAPLPSPSLTVDVSGVAPGTVDLLVFQVTAAGTVRGDHDLVFFNQPASPEGAVRLTGPSTVAVDVGRVPADVDMLRLAVCLDDSVPGSLASIPGLGVRLGPLDAPAIGLSTERAAVLAEIYRRGAVWKVRNVSAGWNDGMAALVTEHGVAVDSAPAPTPPAAPAPPVQAPPVPAPPTPAPVNLQKITLTEATPSLSLAKHAETGGVMRVNLNWTHGRRGIFGGGAVDLDLACLYQLRNGAKGVVQALGGSFGSLNHPPYIHLDGDDRSGQAKGGENLHISLDRLDEFRRILIFAYIYEGAPNWSSANGVVTFHPPGGLEVAVHLDNPDNRARSCAVALLKVDKGAFTVNREVRYINGFQDAVSKAYRWGLTWTPGRK